MRVSKQYPSAADETAALDAFEARALALGVRLVGQQSRLGEDAYFVVARRADTNAPLDLSFRVTLALATDLGAFEAALTQLLTEAVAALVSK